MSEIDTIRDDWAKATRSSQDDIRNLKASHREEREIFRECQSCMNSMLKSLEEKDCYEKETTYTSNMNNLKHSLQSNHQIATKELYNRTSNQLQMQEEDNQARLMRLFNEKQQTKEILTLSLEQECIKRQLLHDKYQEFLKQLDDNNQMQLEDFQCQLIRIKSYKDTHKESIQSTIEEYNNNMLIMQQQHRECLTMSHEDRLSQSFQHTVSYEQIKSKYESDQNIYQGTIEEHKNNIHMATEDLLSHVYEKNTHFHESVRQLHVLHSSHSEMKQKENDHLVNTTKNLEDFILRLEVQLHLEGMLNKIEVSDILKELEYLNQLGSFLVPECRSSTSAYTRREACKRTIAELI